ncbi:MAG: hypothetical protein E7576_13955 [Ruminococcaceae bacterium]|jgi:hypothetical protein|nr:hypothetical protein [Oscillospiraceae bacterium]
MNGKRIITACAAVLVLLTGCRRDKSDPAVSPSVSAEPVQNGAVTEDGMLTCIFRESKLTLPDGAQMLFAVQPYRDPDEGTVTFAAMTRERDEGGMWKAEAGITLFTCTAEGELIGKEETDLRPSLVASSGAVTENAVYLEYGTRDNNALLRWDRKTGETASTGEGTVFFGRSGFLFESVVADADGRIWCTDKTGFVVLNGDLTLSANFDLPSPVSSVARGGDGAVWALYQFGGSVRAARIDPDTGGLGKEYTFYSDLCQSRGSRVLIDAVQPMDCDFCLYDGNAVWAGRGEEDGSVREERLADFANSGIPEFSSLGDFWMEKEGVFPAAVVGEDLILTASGSGGWLAVPGFWLRAPDVDPSNLKTVVLAHCCRLEPAVIAKIRTFPALHPDVRVEVHDYSVYNTDTDPTAGEAQLMFDILNAGFRPDIVASRAVVSSYQRVSDRSLVPQMLKRGLILDLTPWLETDSLVNLENLFGCMRSFFDDGEGGIWGISPTMEADALAVSPAYLPLFGGKTEWTLGEMLDFFEALPADTERYYSMSRKTALSDQNILGDGYAVFFDQDGKMDRELFKRYLAYLSTLPKDLQEWQRINGTDVLNPLPALMNGDCALDRSNCWNERFYAANYRRLGAGVIGFPTRWGSGIRVGTECAFSLTSYAEDEDLCFELVRSFFTLDGIRQNMGYYPILVPFFSLKSLYEEVQFACRSDGRYIYEIPTREELDWTYSVLDRPVIPWLEQTTKEMGELCNEEISAYLSGLGTADDCADKVQSRVSVWLSERS